jgi:hypothetical protein
VPFTFILMLYPLDYFNISVDCQLQNEGDDLSVGPTAANGPEDTVSWLMALYFIRMRW